MSLGMSVTYRISTVEQPKGGYVPKKLFLETQYEDMKDILSISSNDKSLLSIQGLTVDYLTRFMITENLNKSFSIALAGAKKLDEFSGCDDETDKIHYLLSGIKGLDDLSIRNACKVSGYDTAFRAGIKSYRNVDEIKISDEMINNIRTMVERGLNYLNSIGPVIDSEMTFEGGYTDMVSSGDGDYLTKESIIDFKVSTKPFSSHWSLQLLMYYLLGYHSIYSKKYKKLKNLCIFNPYENKSYTVKIDEISDEAKYKVSHEVLGYRMMRLSQRWDKDRGAYNDYSGWAKVDGSDEYVVKEFLRQRVLNSNFDIKKYKDGIHNITVDDYWSCLRKLDKEYYDTIRPIFRYTDHVTMIKKNGYLMFLSVSQKGICSVLNGGRLKKSTFSPEYYYENIERYSNAVVRRFSKYWDALREIAKQLQSLSPSKEQLLYKYKEYLELDYIFDDHVRTFDEWYETKGKKIRLDGRIHGCIVDLDYFNHIYVNPFDGTIVPYSALSMYNKNVYKNVKSLIAKKRPEMLCSLEQLAIDQPNSLMVIDSKKTRMEIATKSDEIDDSFVKVYSHDMYEVSNRLKPLQKLYDYKLIQVWYDEILNDNVKLLDAKYRAKSKDVKGVDDYIGKKKKQKGDKIATIIEYRDKNDIDIRFDDGHIIKNVTLSSWRYGNVIHPDVTVIREKKKYPKKKSNTLNSIDKKKEKYIGMVRKMNCGLNAKVIDYKSCKDLTVEFEDGFVRSGIRSDHFMEGKVARHV